MNSIPLTTLPELERWATFREAMAQPRIWRLWATKLAEQARSVSQWMSARAHTEVWFCGAGTSAFIGETLAPYLSAPPADIRYRAVPTTDLVSCPGNFIPARERLLVVSFGRSGNSSETVGVLDLLDKYLPDADRLHFTCNAEGTLATRDAGGTGEQRVVLLPDETNDRGFAMTSSYSTMLLSALACLDRRSPELVEVIGRLADSAEGVLERSLERAADEDELPSRAIFLGCGALMGSAREAALKVLELTCGRIPTAWDSSLGFRHGPKAIVDDKTRVHLFLSVDEHTRRYDQDAVDEIRRQFGQKAAVAFGGDAGRADIHIPNVYNDAWTSVLYVLAAQIQAIAWSSRLQINVDSPFASGNLSRVVNGVTLYPYVMAR